jgi:hypothetical protein
MTTSSDDILAGLLAECSDAILAGATVRVCLDRHPQHTAALEPLLTTLVDVHKLSATPVRSAAAAARTREQFMTAAVRLSEQRKAAPASWWERVAVWWAGITALFTAPTNSQGLPRRMPVGLLAAMLIVILAGALVTGGVTVSAKALPGDLLYPIKTTGERIQWFVARDPVQRTALEQEFSNRRRQEAQAVVVQGRRVNSLPLDGTLEAFDDTHWTVSGLYLTLDPAVDIIGTPVVGARVHGVLRAPGDGRLLVIYAEAEAPAEGGAPMPVASPPTQTPTRRAATPTATFTPTPEEVSSGAAPAPDLPGLRWREPEDWTPVVPRPTATRTRVRPPTRTPVPSATLAPTLAPTPTNMPPARERIPQRIEGWVERIEGSRWIIDGISAKVSGATQWIGNPGLGWKVSAMVVQEDDGSYTALQIAAIAPPEATPEPVEFTDILREMNGEWWTIGGTPVRVRGDITIEGDPQIGDLVSMKGERHQSEIWAIRIARIPLTVVEFEGMISAVNGSSMVVGGHTVSTDGETQIIGSPEVGRVAQVRAVQMPGGRLIGKVIMVLDPTPTPTITATPTPTNEPTQTPTLEPTPTPTLEPTPTLTAEPMAAPTSKPTSTMTPEPTATASAEGTATPASMTKLRCARKDA